MTQRQTEQLRWAVLRYLAERQGLSFDADQIAAGIATNRMLDFRADAEAVAAAVVFVAGLGWVVRCHDAAGATLYARASSEGVLTWERRRMEIGL